MCGVLVRLVSDIPHSEARSSMHPQRRASFDLVWFELLCNNKHCLALRQG
jgi:hypothetical protein